MSNFELTLHFQPAFGRHCSVRIESCDGARAQVDVKAMGLLPADSLCLPVDPALAEEVRARCVHALANWDVRWSQSGLDGIRIAGSYFSGRSHRELFSLWSPGSDTDGHALLAATLACLPPERCTGPAGEALEQARSYLGLQPPAVILDEQPMRLRVATWLDARGAAGLEAAVATLPPGVDLLVDLSALERPGRAEAIKALRGLLAQQRHTRWRMAESLRDAALAQGIAADDIDVLPATRLSPNGQPIVLGGIVVSEEFLQLARTAARRDLVAAFRRHHSLPISQAAQAAAELVAMLAEFSDETGHST